MATVLMLRPNRDFDPTGAGIPWETLTRLGYAVRFATPEGGVAQADARMVKGFRLGPWKALLRRVFQCKRASVFAGTWSARRRLVAGVFSAYSPAFSIGRPLASR